LQSANNVVKRNFAADQPAGATTISLAAGWIPGATVDSAQFPTNANFNKAACAMTNLQTPSKCLAAATYAAASTND